MNFTVVVPVFNSSGYIDSTLQSIERASKLTDYEIILIDDCSSDIKELKNVIKKFDNVELIEKEHKTNAADSRNRGFLKSKGRHVFFLDSDDFFIEGAIDKRIKFHEESKAGVFFGNYIVKINNNKFQSNLPCYKSEDMRDYLFANKGDFRSSVLSIDKNSYKNALFDELSEKHQDWIFAFRCFDNEEKISFDASYSTIINVGRDDRMSATMNIKASKYLCDKYFTQVSHVNLFSKRHWTTMISNKDRAACDFFFDIYKPDEIIDFFKFSFYKISASRFILPFSSLAIRKVQQNSMKRRVYIDEKV